MRGPVFIMLGVLLLSACVALLVIRRPDEPQHDGHARTTARARDGGATPAPPPRGTRVLQGTVVTPNGAPAAGVEVTASVSVADESLSSIPCSAESPDIPLSSRHCATESRLEVLGLAEEGRGGAPVVARTTSREDGTFTLEGLPGGALALWAVGSQGAHVEPAVRTDATMVRLVLGGGVMFSGRVIDEAMRPQHGASVTLFLDEHSRYFETSADAQGHFSLGPLPDGIYGLVVTQPGYLPEYLSNLSPAREKDPRDVVLHASRRIVGQAVSLEQQPLPGVRIKVHETGQSVTTGEEGRFTLEDMPPGEYLLTDIDPHWHGREQVRLGEEQREVDVRIVLEPRLQVRGTVKDAHGRPIPNARVFNYPCANEEFNRYTSADAEGRFSFDDMPGGSCSFGARATGFMEIETPPITLTHPVPSLDLVLQAAPIVQGVVVDTDGRPVPDVVVLLHSPPRDEDDDTDPTRSDSDTERLETDAEGRFLFTVPRPSRFHLQTHSQHFMTARQPVDAPATDVRLVLRPGGKVEGQVVDSQGAPVEQVQLSLRANADAALTEAPTLSDANGRFSLGGVTPGRHMLVAVFREGTHHRAALPVEVRGTETVTVTMKLEVGLSVSGVVVDESNRPIPSARISARSDPKLSDHLKKPGRAPLYSTVEVVSDEQGRFAVKHLLPGPCTLTVKAVGYTLYGPLSSPQSKDHGRYTTSIVAAGSQDVRLVVRYNGGVRGRLIREDGTPITRFDINQREFRELDGTFLFDVDEPGPRWLSFFAPGLSEVLKEVTVPAGEQVDLGDVVLKPGKRLRGRVLDASTSAPIVGAEVHITPFLASGIEEDDSEQRFPQSQNTTTLTTLFDGTFEFRNLGDERWMLKVDHPDYPPHLQQAGASDIALELRLPPAGRISGTVLDREGHPPSSTLLRVLSLGPPLERRDEDVPLEDDGSFELTQLKPGTYVVGPNDLGFKTPTYLPQTVTLAPGARVTLRFREVTRGTLVRLTTPGEIPPGPSGEQLYIGISYLFRGDLPWPRTHAELNLLAGALSLPYQDTLDSSGSGLTTRLPAGRYTLFVVARVLDSDETYLHRQVVDIPDKEELSLEIPLHWRPLATGP
ncbi:carboxypeptidase regulatory-like domain-containing protein [Myxococcus stipitatus]|uniref:carboxypeptidase regulatory-like domain-containing protein n=1 Tax=Myxococcus stipitatus TaxID=83455 RepID=UPI001F477F76|nr:carboxypeptidase regulatory-like domain-containing protein [Myxococcus stipitatus]MCE9668596.1 carboxypeptidase regulatory-like domain-containing protein [Myxococcus stipitatus]